MNRVGSQLVPLNEVKAKEQVVDTVVNFLECNIFFVERLAHKDLISKDANCSAATDAAYQIVQRVVICADRLRHLSLRWSVDLRMSFHFKPFMRALLVVLFAKLIKLVLPQFHVASRRVRGLLCQGTMHPLVDAVLLRPTRLDELGIDSQLCPPHREAGKPSQGIGSKRGSVVSAHAVGQAVNAKKPVKMSLCHIPVHLRMPIIAQKKARVQVADCLREAVSPVARAEMSFVVRPPDVVRTLGNALGTPRMSPTVTVS